MKLTPHAQKLADDWLDQDGDLRELVEIIGISRGGVGAEIQGHCYRPVKDEDFTPHPIEDLIDSEDRFRKLESREVLPTKKELEAWREAQRESQDSTQFFVWEVPFTRGGLFISTIHGKNGFVDRIDGPFHSADASMPFGEIVLD
ncbi:MAG: hypothetical protein P1U89_07740 [Verrucomicrobiales bacterium]|nr:hypothetical protein [Verrucomicrobiales bacterium]